MERTTINGNAEFARCPGVQEDHWTIAQDTTLDITMVTTQHEKWDRVS
jgi:hypothetical protein